MPSQAAIEPATDPISTAHTPALDRLREQGSPAGARDVVYRELDATLGHPGLPQSATGQATLLTGRNGADAMDGHYGPWPGPTLQRLLDAGNLFHDGVRAGGACLANAYPEGYFEARRGRRFRLNSVAYAAVSAGVPQLNAADHDAGRAVPSDLQGEHLPREGGPLGPIGSARVLSELAALNAFTLLDVWLTDSLGHMRKLEEARRLVERIDQAVGYLVDAEDGAVARGATLIITSDHGNLEDATVATHTRNPVPLYAVGPGAGVFAGAAGLMDVAPAVRQVLSGPEEKLS
ncbi:MAG TPA: hypothetical protein VF164_10965 [Trueperaceae bacterium]